MFESLYRNKGFLYQKYEVERLSANEISKLISSSRSVVLKHLKQFEIPIRQNDQANKNRSQLRYGESWRKRAVVQHQRELQNIAKMKALRSQGFSFWKIADVLNSMKVPTKSRRASWSAKTVHQVLNPSVANVQTPAGDEALTGQ